MMNKMQFSKTKIFSLVLLIFFSVLPLFAQNYYWENPTEITEIDTRFPSAVSSPVKGKYSAVFWEEVDSEKNRLYISASTSNDGVNWRNDKGLRRFIGPVNYSGEVPDIYSVAINRKGLIAVAALTNTKEITVSTSEDGRGFKKTVIADFAEPLVAPRIYSTSTDGFILFASMGQNESFSLYYSTSQNGQQWSEFKEFAPTVNATNAFAPFLVASKDGDIIVFQAQYASAKRFSYQIYSSFSKDNLTTWSEPVIITDQMSLPGNMSVAFTDYNNQRPYLVNIKNKIYMTWERSRYTSDNAAIWFAELSDEGTIKGFTEQITSSNNASRPVLFNYENYVNLLWFDTRSGSERVYFSQKRGALWSEDSLSSNSVNSSFAYPVVTNNGKVLSFVWQQKKTKNSPDSRIVILNQDHTVLPPVISPVTFTEGVRTARKDNIVNIKMSEDSSGVAGYSWIITQDPNAEPKNTIMCKPSEQEINPKVYRDGTWYLKAKQLDFAGNWSDSTVVSFNLDSTPPKRPKIADLKKDVNGMLEENTFTVEWAQTGKIEPDFAGYKISYQLISSLPSDVVKTKRHEITLPKEEIQSIIENLIAEKRDVINAEFIPTVKDIITETNYSYSNQRNGLYKFSVAAVDDLGNTSAPDTVLLPVNKYIPVTYLTSINAVIDEMDVITLTLYGGGFTYDGVVSRIYIDRDGKAPYDRTYSLADGDYKVTSDNVIRGISLFDLDPGEYRIGLYHTDRGLYFGNKQNGINVETNGTVKIQNTYKFTPQWAPVASSKKYHINVGTVLLIIVFIMGFIGLFAAIRGLSSTAQEAITVRAEVTALIEGDIMPQEKKKKTEALKRKGLSLKVRLVGFSVALVVTIVVLVSIPLGFIMTRIQSRTLSSGLHDRVIVLLDSLATGTKAYLPTSDILQLSYLPDQTEALPEAKYATITGMSADSEQEGLNYVWATNDAKLTKELNSEGNSFGMYKLSDANVNEILSKINKLNEEAAEQAGSIAQTISQLNVEGSSLALNSDEESIRRLEEIEVITTELNTRLNSILSDLSSKGTGSYPAYNSEFVDTENTEYLFYKPVLYRQGNDQNYVRGIIFVEVSTAMLVEESRAAMRTIIIVAAIIALIAVLIGIFGSLILATVIIKPIRKLSDHVAMIRDTEDKELLDGKEIKIKRSDEIGLLGETVNDMTKGLVQAARITKNLVVGKDIQTKFIPLQVDRNGNTLTTGALKAKGADFFSYYAGADELSGDYFDYKKLDETHYAIIKCDVSGHGVPAALIMVEVATLFLNYFNDWNFENPYQGIKIAPVVSKINDLLESRGFKGRFAAFTLCILDTQSGDAWFCNAGDNMIHIYDNATHKKKIITLQETPAAGMFSSDLIDMKGGYKVSKLKLNKDDVLFLYTDGIEEAKRNFRDSEYNIINCDEAGLKEGDEHGNHMFGENNEEMTPERVTGIIESVFAKTTYTLTKYHDPDPEAKYTFNFSTCNGTEEEAVMALVSVEKVFRMYKPKEVKPGQKIRVDRKIDQFLRQHFDQYGTYFNDREDNNPDDPFLYYNGVCEDSQYDDLTLVAIKKN